MMVSSCGNASYAPFGKLLADISATSHTLVDAINDFEATLIGTVTQFALKQSAMETDLRARAASLSNDRAIFVCERAEYNKRLAADLERAELGRRLAAGLEHVELGSRLAASQLVGAIRSPLAPTVSTFPSQIDRIPPAAKREEEALACYSHTPVYIEPGEQWVPLAEPAPFAPPRSPEAKPNFQRGSPEPVPYAPPRSPEAKPNFQCCLEAKPNSQRGLPEPVPYAPPRSPEAKPDFQRGLPEPVPFVPLRSPEAKPDSQRGLPEPVPYAPPRSPEAKPDFQCSLPARVPFVPLCSPEAKPNSQCGLPEWVPFVPLHSPEAKPDFQCSLPARVPYAPRCVHEAPDCQCCSPEPADDAVSSGAATEPGGLPSVGAQQHRVGTCTPCKFFRSKRGCFDGANCKLCHFPHADLSDSGVRRLARQMGLAKHGITRPKSKRGVRPAGACGGAPEYEFAPSQQCLTPVHFGQTA